MAHFRFPVFFEARDLTDSEKQKIQKYFLIRRRSGGGECGPVEKVADDTYTISFVEQEDQERVLGPKQHVIPLSLDQQLEIKTKRETTHVSQNQQDTPGRDEEKELLMDTYLTQYLQDNPKARRDLDQCLSSLCRSFRILPEEGKLVVKRGAAQSGLPRAKWEMQVDDVCFQLKQRYRCYFEVHPERVKTLQENPFMRSENLCIYKELGENLAVVVGEHDEIEKMIQRLDALQVKPQVHMDCGITMVKFTLVAEEFVKKIKLSSPQIKITMKGRGVPVFEGSEAEVEAARATLQELVKKIQQRRLQLPAPLLAFLASSGAIQTYQTRFKQSLRSPVMLEVGSDLVLSSLTTEALEEAAATLERDLTVETVVLERVEAESPGMVTLKEVLSQAIQQANHGVMNVQLSYGQPSKADYRMLVQIVGNRKEVDRLKDILLDYKLNQTSIHHFLNLPNAVVADHLHRVLELLGVQHSDLELIATKSPSPGLHFAGPRQLVQDFCEALTSTLQSLVCKEYSVEGPGVLQYFNGEGKNNIVLLELSHKVLILLSDEEKQSGKGSQPTSPISILNLTMMGKTGSTPATIPSFPTKVTRGSSSTATGGSLPTGSQIKLDVVLGNLEDQQVDVLVAPMVKANLLSMKIGQALAKTGGDRLKRNFSQSVRSQRNIEPGDILQVDGTSTLGCQKIIFVECLPWDAASGGSEKALRCGLREALSLCEQRGLSSVAFPLIGPGIVLKTPVKEAVSILTSEIGLLGLSEYTGPLSNIRVVIHPDYPDSKEVCRDVYNGLNLHRMDGKGQAVFGSLTSDLEEVTLMVGGIKLHLVLGDITNETTDAVVNTTDFNNFDSAVCKKILSVAGKKVKKALKSAQVNRGEIFTSQPGKFPSKAIMHVCGENDPELVQDMTRDILLLCESKGYQSVAIPAICAVAGVEPDAILSGIVAAVSSCSFQHLVTVRLVLFSVPVFQRFRAAVDTMFGTPSRPNNTTGSLGASTAPAQMAQPAPLYPNLSPLLPSSLIPGVPPSATFTIIGTSAQDVSSVCAGLQRAYTSHCSQHTLAPEELAALSQAELQDLAERVNSLGVQLDPSGSGSGAGVVVRGLTEGVKDVMYVMQGALRRQVAERDQRELFAQVVWCIMGQRGDWERFPKEANQKLEKGDVSGGVTDAHGCRWNVDLRRKQATAVGSGHVTLVKRLQNLPDFKVPLYWDSLVPGEALQMIPLIPLYAEFELVKADFRKTCMRTILKIERVQNVHLRRAYEVQRQQLEDKNGAPVGAGEKMLYHGTTAQACQSIMKNGFNRGFAGHNATVYGLGTYFAVDASYSAKPLYSRPEADGTQCMFVARVLAGSYTLGKSGMRVPPPVSAQQPDIHFDSLVDNHQNPSMFVVFHDSQAYPDYLITFK
ncbi:protein mono-ADP-ribosyltransferase PARP14-like [Sardina pilchardus]|uniref:protein mono-ADP-ribosyltransferase PARP14-like n=1 Tax=Sardina pilchardus TaxID=27697 RepID=UPI002E117428